MFFYNGEFYKGIVDLILYGAYSAFITTVVENLYVSANFWLQKRVFLQFLSNFSKNFNIGNFFEKFDEYCKKKRVFTTKIADTHMSYY